VHIMVSVHQHLGLDDRHDVLGLAERSVAGERLRVGVDASIARDAWTDVDHRAPFGELGPEPAIFGQPLTEAVEPFGYHLAWAEGQRLHPLVHLDARQRAGCLDDLDERRSILCLLPDGLVEQDHPGDVGHAFGPEQELAIVPAILLGALDPNYVEALLDGTRG